MREDNTIPDIQEIQGESVSAEEPRDKKREIPQGGGRGEEARRRLIAAGLAVFGRFGYEGASTRQIAEEAGVNLSAITYHFKNKAGLYAAVVASIADRMSRPLEPAIARVNATLQQETLTPEQCVRSLLVLLDALAGGILDISHREASLIVPIWIREQIDPTPAFDILYDRIMSRMLQPCSALMAGILKKPITDPECRVRVFALVGQIVIFRLVRLAVLRTLGWSDYDDENTALIRSVIRRHTEGALAQFLTDSDPVPRADEAPEETMAESDDENPNHPRLP